MEATYTQPALTGLEVNVSALEAILTVMSEPEYSRKRSGETWTCTAHPAVWRKDGDEIYAISAQAELARRANSCHVHPGDRIRICGVPQRQNVELGDGTVKIVVNVALEEMRVLSRVPNLGGVG